MTMADSLVAETIYSLQPNPRLTGSLQALALAALRHAEAELAFELAAEVWNKQGHDLMPDGSDFYEDIVWNTNLAEDRFAASVEALKDAVRATASIESTASS